MNIVKKYNFVEENNSYYLPESWFIEKDLPYFIEARMHNFNKAKLMVIIDSDVDTIGEVELWLNDTKYEL